MLSECNKSALRYPAEKSLEKDLITWSLIALCYTRKYFFLLLAPLKRVAESKECSIGPNENKNEWLSKLSLFLSKNSDYYKTKASLEKCIAIKMIANIFKSSFWANKLTKNQNIAILGSILREFL